MTPNDSEMDVLLRRYAKVTAGTKSTDHLEPDELNAFAEGTLPAAARAHYLSHLADCNDCRRIVTELVAASGRVEQVGAAPPRPAVTESWGHRIGTFFAPARLRYAVFAVILVAVAGIGFAIWRGSHGRPTDLVAQSKQTADQNAHPVSQSQEPSVNGVVSPERSPAVAKAVPQPTAASAVDQKLPVTSAVSPPPSKPADAFAQQKEIAPVSTARAAEPSANTAAPSYAPPPRVETERADTRSREQQNLDLIHGPQRGESVEKSKSMDDRSRGTADFAKTRDEDGARTGSDQPGAKEESKNAPTARKRSEPRTAGLLGQSAAGERQEEPKSDKAAPPEEADTRTVGGRKFKRQGNAWVDVKLKSSMSLKTISRGSEDFEKLDSGLRSIAQQFGGPVVVVWKGKAYRIQ